MSAFEANIGQVVHLPFVDKNGATGNAGSYSVVVVKDGVAVSGIGVPVVTEIGSGAYNIAITFTVAGSYTVITDGQVIARVTVYDHSTRAILNSLLDGTMGSWRWDKVSGTYILYGINGNQVATYNIEDTVQYTSRQRTS